ncbi:Usp family protein [Natronococcus pandeyae]|uniref:Usp family protein n=2 Tax=Natronococcus pandeyae TaxID=2055836 RepID=A0A8J8PY62_9EURY|nr:Usp family protein [Natronococcus pandeyae]
MTDMVVVAVVSGTTRAESVLVEAARRADESDTVVHVLYVVGLEWYARLELHLAERLGIPTGSETIRSICERKADRLAAPALEEYEAVGRVGNPIDEIVQYAEQVGADTVVLDGAGHWGGGWWRRSSSLLEQLRERDVPVVPVY